MSYYEDNITDYSNKFETEYVEKHFVENIEDSDTLDLACFIVSQRDYLITKQQQLVGYLKYEIEKIDRTFEGFVPQDVVWQTEMYATKKAYQNVLDELFKTNVRYLYELPPHQNTKIYVDDKVVIFDHIDGFYSYCWLEEDKEKIIHLKSTTRIERYKDGYTIKEELIEKQKLKKEVKKEIELEVRNEVYEAIIRHSNFKPMIEEEKQCLG